MRSLVFLFLVARKHGAPVAADFKKEFGVWVCLSLSLYLALSLLPFHAVLTASVYMGLSVYGEPLQIPRVT